MHHAWHWCSQRTLQSDAQMCERCVGCSARAVKSMKMILSLWMSSQAAARWAFSDIHQFVVAFYRMIDENTTQEINLKSWLLLCLCQHNTEIQRSTCVAALVLSHWWCFLKFQVVVCSIFACFLKLQWVELSHHHKAAVQNISSSIWNCPGLSFQDTGYWLLWVSH